MAMSSAAKKVLNELMDTMSPFEIVEEYENQGICEDCGHIQDGVEPDAHHYKCDNCGEHAVCGIESAFIAL